MSFCTGLPPGVYTDVRENENAERNHGLAQDALGDLDRAGEAVSKTTERVSRPAAAAKVKTVGLKCAAV